jgi:cytochrome d ubiquinol oxidase subunit I
MQTPAGYTVAPDGRFLPTDWMAIIFNPSVFVRFPHMILASYLSVAFVVGATGAWHLLRDRGNQRARTMFSMAMWMAAIVAPAQIVMGDIHGLNTLEHQPAKIAAMEGNWESTDGAPLTLFGLPNMAQERTDYAIEIPHLSSLILTHSWNGSVPGLKDFPRQDRPDSTIVFWSFRLMVGIGFAMLGLGAWSLWARYKRQLYESTWLQRVAIVMGPSGFLAILSGWVTTEVGRQPFTVYGLLRTANSIAPIALPGVATSLAIFAVVYFVVFGSGVLILLRMMGKTPEAGEDVTPPSPIRTAGITPGNTAPQPAE